MFFVNLARGIGWGREHEQYCNIFFGIFEVIFLNLAIVFLRTGSKDLEHGKN